MKYYIYNKHQFYIICKGFGEQHISMKKIKIPKIYIISNVLRIYTKYIMKSIYFIFILILILSLFLGSQIKPEPFSNENTRWADQIIRATPTPTSRTPPLRIQTTNSPTSRPRPTLPSKKYDSNNYDITYHTDPTKDSTTSENNLEFGYVWIQDKNGKLSAYKPDDIQHSTLYYPFGSKEPNPTPFIPTYEESVVLSKFSVRNSYS